MTFTAFVLFLSVCSIVSRVYAGTYMAPCKENSECGLDNNVCVGCRICGCGAGQQPFFRQMQQPFPQPPKFLMDGYVCTKACKFSSECDQANHEECVQGSCACQSKYVRINSLRCVPALGTDLSEQSCPPPSQPSPNACDPQFGISCPSMPGNVFSCSHTGVCCFTPAPLLQ